MLDPNERASVLEMLRPPADYELAAGFGTAFSVQLDVLTAVLLALAGGDAGDGELVDPVGSVRAIRRLGSRLRVVVNRGRIAADLGRAPVRLVALFDGVLREIGWPESAFHPKVWALKFEPRRVPELRGAKPIYRMVCSSRNITDSRAWELGVWLEGRDTNRITEAGQDLAAFARRVLGSGGAGSPPLVRFAEELARVEFERSRETAESVELLWQWPARSGLITHLPKAGRRAVLVTPFVRGGLVREISSRFEQTWLVSTQSELDALPEDALGASTSGRVYVVGNSQGAGREAFDLHAKVLLTEDSEGSRTYAGSANGTNAAWGYRSPGNCEAVVVLKPGIGIDRFLRAFVRRSDGVLHPWIEPYARSVPAPPDEDEKTLERIQRDVACLRVGLSYDAARRQLVIRTLERLPEDLVKDMRFVVEVAPLLLQERDGAFRPLAALEGVGTAYASVEVGEVSDFVTVRVRDPRNRLAERRFMILATSSIPAEVRERRDDALCMDLLRNVNARALLWTVLWGPGSIGTGHGGRRRDKGGRDPRSPDVLGEVTIERLIEACTEDPARIGEVDAVLRVVSTRNDLEPAFYTFWAAFKRAYADATGENQAS